MVIMSAPVARVSGLTSAWLLGALVMVYGSMVCASETGKHIAEQGAAHASAVACATCHGADGGGNDVSGFPRLAGLNAAYLEKQLQSYKDGSNRNPVMASMAGSLTPGEIKGVAAYYASMDAVSHAAAPAGVPTDMGEKLAVEGDFSTRGLPACVQCHGPGGLGVGSVFPPLAGQPFKYIEEQLAAWKSGIRTNDPLGMMKYVAELLTADEARSVAAWFASQPVSRGGKDRTKKTAAKTSGKTAAPAVHTGPLPHHGEVTSGRISDNDDYFSPPSRADYPDGPFGEKVKQGEAIFNHTNTHAVSRKYVGNEQVCSGCHLDTGRLANSAPLWGAWVSYPTYRRKTKSVNTLIERIQGCFKYSMNVQGSEAKRPPAADSDTIVSLVSYAYWLSTDAPTGDKLIAGRGYRKIPETGQGFDPARGKVVFEENCAVCHGANGAGQWARGEVIFPALWGPDSYNWGAGMHKVNTAAAYIKWNMPLGIASPVQMYTSLTDQQAWDVAAFINSHERPQDPRFNGNFARTASTYHSSKYDYYGKLKQPNGKLLGENAPRK
jgi:thiosulfate dehydrogenase